MTDEGKFRGFLVWLVIGQKDEVGDSRQNVRQIRKDVLAYTSRHGHAAEIP